MRSSNPVFTKPTAFQPAQGYAPQQPNQYAPNPYATGYGAPTVETVDSITGRKLKLALVDPETGVAAPREQIRLRPGPGADEAVRRLLDNLENGGSK